MMNRHVSLGEFILNSPAGLCGSSTSVLLLFGQQSCNNHEVICKHGGSHQQFKPLATFSQATLHAPPTEKNGDSTFNTGSEALAILEARAFFIRCLFHCFFATAL